MANDWTLHDSWQYQGFEDATPEGAWTLNDTVAHSSTVTFNNGAVPWSLVYWTTQEAAFNIAEEGELGSTYRMLMLGIG